MSRMTQLLERNTRKANRRSIVAIIIAILALASGGGYVYAAVSAQTGPLYACFNDTSGGIVRVLPYAAWTEYQHACSSNSHLRSAASADAVTQPPTTPSTSRPTTTTTPSTTQPPTTTTTRPTTTTTNPGNIGDIKPPSGGYFQTLPPGTPLPSESACASRVHYSTWEPRPDNTIANHTLPVHPEQLANFTQWDSTWNNTYKPRIDGAFQGTTDQIIQFYACKWGLSDEQIRAEAVVESTWHQSTVGDNSTSYGLLQIRYLYHPNVNNTQCKSCVGSSWPNSQNSTAYNVDQQSAEIRGCYDGHSTYLNGGVGKTTGDMPGCLGQWYSGAWHDSGAQTYIGWYNTAFNNKAWLGWSG